MSMQLPANQSGLLVLDTAQTVTLGTPGLDLSSGAAFTLAVWAQVPQVQGSATVIAQGTGLAMGFDNGVAWVRVNGVTVRTNVALDGNRWYQLVATVAAGTQPTLSLSVNGAFVGSAPFAAATGGGGALVVGGNAPVSVLRVALWDSCFDQQQLAAARFGDMPITGDTPAPVLGVDFARIPAAGTGTAELAWNYGAAQSVATPGMEIAAGCVNVPLPDGTTIGDFTIQGWVYIAPGAAASAPNQAQWIWAADTGSGRFGMQVVPSHDGTWSLMVSVGNEALGRAGADLSGWHNLAVRGTTAGGAARVYIDGQPLTQGTLPAVAGPTPATYTIGRAPDATGQFKGVIQGLTIWPSQLSDATIAANLRPIQAYDQAPISACLFTLGPARELVEGQALTTEGDAGFTQNILPASAYAPPESQVVAKVARPTRKKVDLSAYKPLAAAAVDASQYTPERAQQLLAAAEAYLAQLDPARAAGVRAQVKARLDRIQAAGRAGIPLGAFHTEVQGGDAITFFFDESGPRAVYARSAKQVDPCFDWMVDMSATAIFGVLSVLEVPVTPGIVTEVIETLLKKSKVWKAIAEVFAEEITAWTCVAAVKALNDVDFLETFIDAILDNLSWWDFLWMCADVILELVALFIPGVELTIMLAHLAIAVTQLLYVAAHKPSGCLATAAAK